MFESLADILLVPPPRITFPAFSGSASSQDISLSEPPIITLKPGFLIELPSPPTIIEFADCEIDDSNAPTTAEPDDLIIVFVSSSVLTF